MTFLATIGRAVLGLLAAIGSVTLFAIETVSHLARPPFYPREFAHALLQIGYFSLLFNELEYSSSIFRIKSLERWMR